MKLLTINPYVTHDQLGKTMVTGLQSLNSPSHHKKSMLSKTTKIGARHH